MSGGAIGVNFPHESHGREAVVQGLPTLGAAAFYPLTFTSIGDDKSNG